MTIYLDFDGTVVEHAYPEIGAPVPEAMRVLKGLKDKGHKIILNTMRLNFKDGSELSAFIYLWQYFPGLTDQYCTKKLHPHPFDGSRSDFLFIDDTQEGIPLMEDSRGAAMVDWLKVETCLREWGVL